MRRGAAQSDQLLLILTALANLRVQPEALAQFLLAVPDEVLRRCGVILARMAGEEGKAVRRVGAVAAPLRFFYRLPDLDRPVGPGIDL